jgi:group I intron endonuclease
MRKYGVDSFKVETLYEAVNLRELIAVEKGLIAQYGTMFCANGYNQSSGGESRSGVKLTDVTKAKLSIASKKQFLRCGHPMEGKKHTMESRVKMSCSAKNRPTGKIMPREAVESSRQKRTGIKRTQEQCAKIAAGRVGRGVGNQGARKYSAQIIKNALEFIVSGHTQIAASKLFGVSSSHLSRLLSGDRQQNRQRGIS